MNKLVDKLIERLKDEEMYAVDDAIDWLYL